MVLDQKPESNRQDQFPRGPGPAHPDHEFLHEAHGPALGVGRTLAHPDVEHLARPCPDGDEGVVTEHLGVAIAGTVFGLAAHLADGGVEVDDELLGPRSRPEGPGPAQRLCQHPVELTDVAEGEGPEERAQRGGRHHPVPEHRLGGPRAQHVGVVDVGTSRRHGVHQRQHLASRQSPTDTTREVDRGVDKALETEASDQRGHHQQPGVGHQIGLVEGHLDAVNSARYFGH